jgi:uroporphyrinogen-III decarboxylase
MAGTPTKVDECVKELLVELKPGGGFIMSPDVSIPYTTKPENVKALGDAVKKCGVY